jgi:ElaB/YqjD/DUF883 family membrane-anchored ribosome-binding protein
MEKDNMTDAEGSASSATQAANKVDSAIKGTAESYLEKAGVHLDLERIEQGIRERPLVSAGIAAATGFVVGGGLGTRPGIALLALLGRQAARETVTKLATESLASGRAATRSHRS